MSLFDPNIIPTECGTPEYIEAVNTIINQFRARKVRSLSLAGERRTANLLRSYIQSHIRRCLEYIEGGHAAFYAGRCLVTYACARANYENVAAFCDFASSLIPLLEGGNHQAVHEFVEMRALSTRIPEFIQDFGKPLSAQNILTQIDKMKAKYEGIRKAYNHLSDFVHPNGLGAVVHFVSIDGEIATFNDFGKNQHWALADLIASGFLLCHMEIAITEIEQRLSPKP